MQKQRIYIGIDDTDNKYTRGTGFRARQLAALILEKAAGDVLGVSRHQLFFDPRVPYTSHNSSACIEVISSNSKALIDLSEEFLLEIAAEGSDVGLCVAPVENISKEVITYATKAKIDIVTQADAKRIAAENNIFLKGLTGTHDGIIGSLSAVGLRLTGNDGRFMWLKGKELRDISGIMTINELFKLSSIDRVETEEGLEIPKDELILLSEWIRPVLKNHKKTLITEEVKNEKFKWRLKSKEFIKDISN